MPDELNMREGAAAHNTKQSGVMPRPVLTVAVTGHRDIGDERNAAHLHSTICDILVVIDDLARQQESQIECRLISALAAGADQVTAAAMDTPRLKSKWALHVVLPFESGSYRAGLADGLTNPSAADVQGRYDTLLGKADRVFELADWALPTGSSLSPKENYLANRRYATLGNLLVRQADIMLAVWRGDPADGVGGTADVVAKALRDGVPVVRIDPDTRRVAILIDDIGDKDAVILAEKTPLKEALVETQVDTLKAIIALLLHPSSENDGGVGPASLDALCESRDKKAASDSTVKKSHWFPYSVFVWLLLRPGGHAVWPGFGLRVDDMARMWQRPDSQQTRFLDKVDGVLRPIAVPTDARATRDGHAYRSSYIGTFLGAVLAVWIGLAGLLFKAPYKWVFVTAELIVLVALVSFYFVVVRRNWHRRWLNARHISESLRGSRHVAWLGFAGRQPLKKNAPLTAWFTNAVMAVPGVPEGRITPTMLAVIAHELRTFHVPEQCVYHKNNHERSSHLHHRLDRIGWVCLGTAILAATAYLMYRTLIPHTDNSLLWPGYAVTAICAAFPLLAAALAGIRYQGDFERLGKRSFATEKALYGVLERLEVFEKRALQCGQICASDQPPPFEELLQIIIDLSDTYAADLEDWRFVYSARPNPAVG